MGRGETELRDRTCQIEGCENAIHARKLCNKHYRRMRDHGTTDDPVRKRSVCKIDGCDRFVNGHGLCSTHYSRVRLHGNPQADVPVNKARKTPEESFSARTKWSGDCLIWTGSKSPGGYGRIYFGGRGFQAHRYAWERAQGPIPEGMLVDHICWNRACVNVEHLRLATFAENAIYQETVSSSTGYKNVYRDGDGYQVHLQWSGGERFYKRYKTLDEAVEAARHKRMEIYGEFAGVHQRGGVEKA